jgi:hypothetical protein
MIRDKTINHFARFDTAQRLALLKSFFGDSIQAAGRFSRIAVPPISRQNPAPVFRAERLNVDHTVGAIIGLPGVPTVKYHSPSPGIDMLYYPVKQQLTVQLRYTIAAVTDTIVWQQLLGLPPLPAQNNGPLQLAAPEAVVPGSNFELEGSLFVVICVMDEDAVISEVVETDDAYLQEGDKVLYAFDLVQQAVINYYRE